MCYGFTGISHLKNPPGRKKSIRYFWLMAKYLIMSCEIDSNPKNAVIDNLPDLPE